MIGTILAMAGALMIVIIIIIVVSITNGIEFRFFSRETHPPQRRKDNFERWLDDLKIKAAITTTENMKFMEGYLECVEDVIIAYSEFKAERKRLL